MQKSVAIGRGLYNSRQGSPASGLSTQTQSTRRAWPLGAGNSEAPLSMARGRYRGIHSVAPRVRAPSERLNQAKDPREIEFGLGPSVTKVCSRRHEVYRFERQMRWARGAAERSAARPAQSTRAKLCLLGRGSNDDMPTPNARAKQVPAQGRSSAAAPASLRGTRLYRAKELLGQVNDLMHKALCVHASRCPLSLSRDFPPNLRCGLVGSEPDINRVSQEPVAGPGQISDFGDELRLNPMHAGKNERRSEAGLAWRRRAERRCSLAPRGPGGDVNRRAPCPACPCRRGRRR